MNVPLITLNDQTKIPQIGLGTWQLEGNKCIDAIKMALDIGYRHIDTAYAYYNQKQIGRAIKGFDRDKLFLTSKLWLDHMKPELVEKELNICLKDLGVDYLDLYLVHWPDHKNLVSVVEKMHQLKEMGKIRSVGISNAGIHHMQDLLDADLPFSINQVEFHPYFYQDELLSFCQKHKIVIEAYSPIAHGDVTKDTALIDLGQKYGKTASQISLIYLVQKGLIILPKASSKEHLEENFAIFDCKLRDEDLFFIDAFAKKKAIRQIKPDFHQFDY